MKYFMLTGLGNIEYIGEFDDFSDADDVASNLGYDPVWIGDEETFKRWDKQMNDVKEKMI